jgi:hypothetical protein
LQLANRLVSSKADYRVARLVMAFHVPALRPAPRRKRAEQI